MKMVCKLSEDGFEVEESKIINLNCKKEFKYTFWKQNNIYAEFYKDEIVLCEQLNKNINNDLKKQILIMILESIVNDEKSGLISQLAELTYYFLGKNRNYASRVFNTIIMLDRNKK